MLPQETDRYKQKEASEQTDYVCFGGIIKLRGNHWQRYKKNCDEMCFFFYSLCHLYGQVVCLSTIWLVVFIYLFVTVFGKAAFRELLYKKTDRASIVELEYASMNGLTNSLYEHLK